jgi:putative membrane protein
MSTAALTSQRWDEGGSAAKWSVIGLWAIMALLAANGVAALLQIQVAPLRLAPVVLLILFAVWHGTLRYGWIGLLGFFVVAQVVSNGFENLSISTGFPFGHYYYPPGFGAFLFQVPLFIGFSYFSNGYLAWVIANIILDRPEERLGSWFNRITLPLIATFVMVMWDVAMDPWRSTVQHIWIWQQGGGFNGVPLSNYLGWYLTNWVIFQLFTLFLAQRPAPVRRALTRGFAIPVIILYALNVVTYVAAYLYVDTRSVADRAGETWRVQGILETAVIVGLFGMLFVTALALIRTLQPLSRASSET